jgi:hypothetical protein
VAVTHPELLDVDLATGTLIPEAQRMKALIDDLMLLARADERGLTVANDDVDLDDLASAEVERLRRKTSLDVRADISPARLTGDAEALSRVLRNLLDNAARHGFVARRGGPAPRGRFRAGRRRRRRDGHPGGRPFAGVRPLRQAGPGPLAQRGRYRPRPGDRAGDRGGARRHGVDR